MPIPHSLVRRRAGSRRTTLLLVALSAACRTWRAEPLPVAGAPARAIPSRVRATRADGSQVELARARIAGDTLRGERWEIDRSGRPAAVAVPLDSVRRLEARRVSVARTAAVGVAGAMVLVFFVGSVLEAGAYAPDSR